MAPGIYLLLSQSKYSSKQTRQTKTTTTKNTQAKTKNTIHDKSEICVKSKKQKQKNIAADQDVFLCVQQTLHAKASYKNDNIKTAQNHKQTKKKKKSKQSSHPSSSMHHPFQVSLPTNLIKNTQTNSYENDSQWRKQEVFRLLQIFIYFFALLPSRFFSNLRTACSETLMLRERKASMADRSLSSLTGELLLLATGAAFDTFAARRLGGEAYPWQRVKGTGQGWCLEVKGWVIVKVPVVWE